MDNLLQPIDLKQVIGSDLNADVAYAAMTDEQLWIAVGRELASARGRAGYSSTLAVYRQVAGAPATGTLEDIENGRVGNLDRVDAYCRALRVTFVDVLRKALSKDDDVLSADAQWVGRMYQTGPNQDLRKVMRDAARMQETLRRASHAMQPTPSNAPPETADDTRSRTRKRQGRQ